MGSSPTGSSISLTIHYGPRGKESYPVRLVHVKLHLPHIIIVYLQNNGLQSVLTGVCSIHELQKGNTMTHTIQLDLVFENDISELYDHFANTQIDFKIIEEIGPGGGWPVCELTSDETTLRDWLLNNYCDETQINFYMGFEG